MTDPLAEIRRWVDLITCGQMEREEARRTIVVPTPELAVEIEAMAAAAGLGDLWTVKHNQYAPDGYVYIIDEQAIDAGLRESLQQSLRRPWFA